MGGNGKYPSGFLLFSDSGVGSRSDEGFICCYIVYGQYIGMLIQEAICCCFWVTRCKEATKVGVSLDY